MCRAKTGSGQMQTEKTQNRFQNDVVRFTTQHIMLYSCPVLRQNQGTETAFAMPFYAKNASFYQDRLGTNTGKEHSKTARVSRVSSLSAGTAR
jgi:hypothetical protein